MSEAETKQISGVCEEISERGEWTTFHVNVGGQWPVKLSTKLPALVDQGRAAAGKDAVWTFKESQGKENPNKPGTYFQNRYMEKVEIGGEVTPTVTGNVPPAPSLGTQASLVDWDAKERRDYRSRAWAQTLGAFTHTIKVDEPVEDVFKRLLPFQRAVFTDVCQSFAYPVVDEDENIPFDKEGDRP